MIRIFIIISLLLIAVVSKTQLIDSLNTAKNIPYMSVAEREMIYEINRVRSNPKSYLQYLQPMLNEANEKLKKYGKGNANYSLTTTTETKKGKEIKTIDTTWHYSNEEEVKALTTLIDNLKKINSLTILKPDKGIYMAAAKHAKDQHENNWQLGHTGSDGSRPWDRITKFSPSMLSGSENIAGNSATGITARDIVIQLLIDSGIPGYGHRFNLLNPSWEYVACKEEHFKGMWWWIQNFGVKRK